MSKKGLKKWFDEKWVDISAKKPGGGYKECGRKSASKSSRGYPKCVPASKAAKMSKGEIRSAVARKRSAANTGPKPTNVKTKLKGGGALTVTPQVSTDRFSDDFSTTTIQRGGVEIGKEFGFGYGSINPYIQREITESEYYPTQKIKRKGVTGQLSTDFGDFTGSYSETPMGDDYSIGFSKTFKFNKGGMNKHSTINQEDTYVGTGGFADSNYQQQVKKLLEE